MVNTVKILVILNNLLNLPQKKEFKNSKVTKIADKITGTFSQSAPETKKYQKQNIYRQKKGNKLIINLD